MACRSVPGRQAALRWYPPRASAPQPPCRDGPDPALALHGFSDFEQRALGSHVTPRQQQRRVSCAGSPVPAADRWRTARRATPTSAVAWRQRAGRISAVADTEPSAQRRRDHGAAAPAVAADRRAARAARDRGRRAHAGQLRASRRPRAAAQLGSLVGAASRRQRNAQPSAERSRQRQGDRRAGHSTMAAPASASATRSAPALSARQQQPGQQHGPQRHQVEQQHHAHHVADRHGPVEAGVGRARGQHQHHSAGVRRSWRQPRPSQPS